MSRRIIQVNAFFFEWPVGANRPSTYAITPESLPGYLARTGDARIANLIESEAALAANLAGPNNIRLSANDLVACYRDEVLYEQYHVNAGSPLPSLWRN